MEKLLAGVVAFQDEVFPHEREHFAEIATGQRPLALFITCADSRIDPNLITRTRPGELFICRDVGNIVPAHGDVYGGVSATIEYAVSVLRVPHVIICGHSDCGAMRALVERESVRDLPNVFHWLNHAEPALESARAVVDGDDPDVLLREVIRRNVEAQLDNLRTHPEVAAATAEGWLQVHGWTYDIGSGGVDVHTDEGFAPAREVLRRLTTP